MVDNITTTTSNTPLSTLISNGRSYSNNNMIHSSVNPKTVMADNIATTT
jgi:hypothetical protein